MEREKFFSWEMPPSPESQEKEKAKEIYLNEVFGETKNKLRKYLPDFYKSIPTKLNYQDNAKDLKVNHNFEGENLNINIRTPKNLSGKTVEDLKKMESNFLVFKDVAKNETIPKKIQDFFFLCHEYAHGINQILFKEYRPDIVQIQEAKRKEFEKADEIRKKELLEELKNSMISRFGEDLAISIERIMTDKILEDEAIDDQEKAGVKKFWENHEKSLRMKKLENDPESKYSEFDENMMFYKIYQQFGESGILRFIQNFDFNKFFKIKRYSDLKQRVLSEEYKKILEWDANKIIKEFVTERKNGRGELV